MAINLIEAARLAANNGETKKAGIIYTFAQQSMLLQAIPTVSIAGNSYSWTREAALPTVGTRGVNEAYTESAGSTVTLSEPLKMYGGDLDVDNFIVQTGGSVARTTHEMMKAKALAQAIGYAIVKGSVNTEGGATADSKGLHGLQARYGGGFGGTAVSTSGPNAGQLVANTGASDALSLAKLDEAIMKVDRPTHLLMPKKMRINIKTLLRGSASLSMTTDEFGGPVDVYNGLPILDADINGDQAGIAFNEGASSNRCSIYAVSLAADGLHLIQNGGGVSVRDLGEQDSKPVWRTRAEWYIGLVDEFPRCVSRLYQIADSAAVA